MFSGGWQCFLFISKVSTAYNGLAKLSRGAVTYVVVPKLYV